MDRFHLMSVFVAVAEEASFAAAARRLRMSPPAVTRAVAMLEKRLGVGLLSRTTRLVRTTDAGARYLEDARRILLDADEADEAAAGINSVPRGHLAVTAPVLFGKIHVMPIITDYLTRYGDTRISALFVDRVVNLLDEGLDVGVRIGALPDSSLIAIRVGRVHRIVCAAPSYLASHGAPQTPAELAGHTVISAPSASSSVQWFFAKGREKVAVQITPRIVVNTNDAAIEAARSGFGLARLLSYQVAGDIESGTLQPVLTSHDEESLPVHVIHREGRQGSGKVRGFVDIAVEQLRANRALA